MLAGVFLVGLFTTISAAVTISACSQTEISNIFRVPPADFVIVSTCTGKVVLDSSLSVRDGIVFNATGRLTLVAGGNFPVFNILGTAIIQGVTLKSGPSTDKDGGCMTVASEANATLIGVTFADCHTTGLGGGLYLNAGAFAELNNVAFKGTSASNGGALALAPTAQISCTKCNFINGTANGIGGGAVYLEGATAYISNSWFISNEATNTDDTSSGGAVYSQDSSFSCAQCRFLSNVASGPGGAFCGRGATPVNASGPGAISFVDTVFLNNTGASMGGAVYTCLNGDEQLLLQNGAVCDNELVSPQGTWVGTAVHVECEGAIGADSVSFAGNTDGNEFVATSSVLLQFFQFCEVGTPVGRETCDFQQNLTLTEQTPPSSNIVSSATTQVVAATMLLFPLLL